MKFSAFLTMCQNFKVILEVKAQNVNYCKFVVVRLPHNIIRSDVWLGRHYVEILEDIDFGTHSVPNHDDQWNVS